MDIDPAFTIPPQEPLTQVGECMYCRKAPPEVKLTDEHPIPYSLGGHRYLPHAACTECIKNTHAFIGNCSGAMFHALRLHHSLPSRSGRKRRPRKETIAVEVGMGGDKPPLIKELQKDEAPGMVIFPLFDLPGLIFDRQLSNEIRTVANPVFTFTTPDALARFETVRDGKPDHGVSLVGGQPYEFAKLLAHIAYGYYVAQFGIPDSSPLPAIIMGDDPYLSHWVGGTPDVAVVVPPPAHGTTLHQVYAVHYLIDGVGYIAAQIRLFAYLAPTPPVYSVIMGRREIPKRDQYFAFTSDKAADRVLIEGPVSRI